MGCGLAAGRGEPGPAPAPSEGRATGRTISPYGIHQAGITAATPRVVEIVALDLLPGVDREGLGRLMRQWTGDIVALAHGRPAPGDTAPWLAAENADLTVTVGLGPAVFVEGRAVPRPPGLVAVPAMRHDQLEERWSGGDLVLVVGAAEGTTVAHTVRRLVADAAPFAVPRWRQAGFWNGVDGTGAPVTGRNLFGQVDGSANPAVGSEIFDRTVWVADGAWSGGTTMVLRRIRMDLSAWDGLTLDAQQRAVGRRLEDGAPVTGGREADDVDLLAEVDGLPAVAPDAHVRRAHPTLNGGARIFRKGANYVSGDGPAPESGLLFMSFQADIAGQFVPLQRALDTVDALNEWTVAIGSAEFAILPGFEEGGWLGETVLA